MLKLAGMVSLVLFALAAPPSADAVREEQKKFDGNWQLVSAELGGAKMPAEQVKEFTLTFRGAKFSSHHAGESKAGDFTVDHTKSPKTIDLTPADGPDKGKTWSLIYTLEGDTLKVCGREVGKPRPDSFEMKDKEDVILMVFRRK
jgi:uncharacterized protein (TIGR03067 family)